MERTLIGIGKASEFLGVHPDTLRAWESQNQITPIYTEGGHRRYDLSDLMNFRLMSIYRHGGMSHPVTWQKCGEVLDEVAQDSGFKENVSLSTHMPILTTLVSIAIKRCMVARITDYGCSSVSSRSHEEAYVLNHFCDTGKVFWFGRPSLHQEEFRYLEEKMCIPTKWVKYILGKLNLVVPSEDHANGTNMSGLSKSI